MDESFEQAVAEERAASEAWLKEIRRLCDDRSAGRDVDDTRRLALAKIWEEARRRVEAFLSVSSG